MPETMGSAAAKVLRSFCVLSGALSFFQRLGCGPFSDPRKPLGFKRDLDVRETSRNAPRSRENRGFANIEPTAVQHAEMPTKWPSFPGCGAACSEAERCTADP